jgi:hypothetical protein
MRGGSRSGVTQIVTHSRKSFLAAIALSAVVTHERLA